MEFGHIPRSKANYKPVTDYYQQYPEGIKNLLQHYPHVLPVFINRTTMKCLNPHILQAYQKHTTLNQFPAIFIQADRRQEILLSLAINGGLDGHNVPTPSNIEAIINTMAIATNEQLAAIAPLDYIADISAYYANKTEESENEPKINEDRGSFSYDDLFDIPLLDISQQGKPTGADWTRWGSRARTASHEAIHFYTDDYKFSSVEGKPEIVSDTGATVAIEVNYSTEPSQPRVMALMDVWKKRTAARVWQDNGMTIIVDMNVNRRFFDINFIGVPSGWASYATRHYAVEGESYLHETYARCCEHAGTDDIDFFVYGHSATRIVCAANGWHWISSKVA